MIAGYKKGIGEKIFDFVNPLFMIIFCISIIIPFWDMFITSFSSADEALSLTLRFWPSEWRLAAYKFAFRNSQILNAYVVTIARTVVGTVLHIIVNVSIAYSLSKKELPFRNFLTTIVLIPMFFTGGLIPSYLLIRSLHLDNTFWVYILPTSFSPFVVVLLRNYFSNMEKALEESAVIDGASYLRIMFQIIMPLAKPIIATVALWSMVAHWNAWFDSLIYVKSKKLQVLQLILRRMIDDTKEMSQEMAQFTLDNPDSSIVTKNIQAAITIITVAPIIATYPFLQKYFVKGIMIGSLKG